MPIKVVVARAGNGTLLTEETHKGAEHFIIRDGMLFVMQSHYSDSPAVAAYAPGQWSSVEMLQEAAS